MEIVGYLIIEVPDLQVPGVPFTVDNPGCTLDLVVTPEAGKESETLDVLLLARGVHKGRVAELVSTLSAAFPPARTLERDDDAGTWLSAFRIPLAAFQDRRAATIATFLREAKLRLYWLRVEDGLCFIRVEIPRGIEPEALAERCRGFLEGSGIDADVALEPPTDDFGPWRELVQRALDRSSGQP